MTSARGAADDYALAPRSHFRTLALSHSRTLALSHSRTLALSHSRTLALSHSRTQEFRADPCRPAGTALPPLLPGPPPRGGVQPRAVRAPLGERGGRDGRAPPRRRADQRARPADAGARRHLGSVGERRGRRRRGGPREPRARASRRGGVHAAARVAHAPRHPPLLSGVQQPVPVAALPPAAGPHAHPLALL